MANTTGAEDREKTAFVCEYGLFEFNVLSFGLCNSASTFQRIMDAVLKDVEGVLVYIDDTIITGKTFPETVARFETVMQRLRDANLKMNLSKTDCFEKTIEFLRHDISAKGVRPSEYKLKAVKEFPVPNP